MTRPTHACVVRQAANGTWWTSCQHNTCTFYMSGATSKGQAEYRGRQHEKHPDIGRRTMMGMSA